MKLNGNPDEKVTSDSAYLWPKTPESEIYNSGFPKMACQGCHISERCGRISKKIMVGKSESKLSKTDVVRSHGYLSGAFPLTVRRNVCCQIIKRGKESRGRRAEWFSRLRIACVNVASALTENWSKPKTVLAPGSDFLSLSAESY